MSLDPSIALQVQPVQIQNPLTQYAQLATIQDAQQRNRLLDLGIQDKQREIAQAGAVNDAYARNYGPNGLNQQQFATDVAGAGYGSALPAIQKQFTDAATSQAALQKQQLENGIKKIEAAGQLMNGVTDQASYDRARAQAAQHPELGADLAAKMPPVYDPAQVEQARVQAMSVKDQMSQALQQLTLQETHRHNLVDEGNTVRGQDMTQQTAQRGQDMTAATETRAQNLRALDFDAKNGIVVNKATGQTIQVKDASGNPIANAVGNLNGEQSNAVAFGARMTDAQNMLRQLEGAGTTSTNAVYRTVSGVPGVGGALGAATNWLNNDQQQSYEQAARNFVSANLRKESGAAISNEEFSSEYKKYFPQPGDTAATIQQKARARDLAIEAMKAQAGPGASLIAGIIAAANQDSNQPAAAPQAKPNSTAAPAAQVSSDAALAELRRRAANNPQLAAKLQAMGH